MPRGCCPACGQHIVLRVTGVVRHHRLLEPGPRGGLRPSMASCPGSQQPAAQLLERSA